METLMTVIAWGILAGIAALIVVTCVKDSPVKIIREALHGDGNAPEDR